MTTVEPRQTPLLTDTSRIPGWGVDANPDNDPTYPMRDQSKDDAPGMNWARPPQQPQTVEILRSIEHNRMPAVFGTATPPRGLSGAIRRTAFKYSESQWAHWLLLVLADRIDMVEGLAEDLAHGKVPNLVQEMGLSAQWKYNRPAFVRRTATTLAVSGALVGVGYLIAKSRHRRY